MSSCSKWFKTIVVCTDLDFIVIDIARKYFASVSTVHLSFLHCIVLYQSCQIVHFHSEKPEFLAQEDKEKKIEVSSLDYQQMRKQAKRGN